MYSFEGRQHKDKASDWSEDHCFLRRDRLSIPLPVITGHPLFQAGPLPSDPLLYEQTNKHLGISFVEENNLALNNFRKNQKDYQSIIF